MLVTILPAISSWHAMATCQRSLTSEVTQIVYELLFAGHETTTALIANAARRLLTDRDTWEEICGDSSLIPNAIEEVLRFDSSVIARRRKTTEAVEIGGVPVPADANLLLLLGSANRDPAVFADPDHFFQDDVTRFIRASARLVKPGGIVAFHEIDDADDFAVLPEVPLWKQANDWLMLALRSLLPNPDVPGRLVDCFSLGAPFLFCEVPIGDGARSAITTWLVETLRTLLPQIIPRGWASEDAVDIDSLEKRLRPATSVRMGQSADGCGSQCLQGISIAVARPMLLIFQLKLKIQLEQFV